MYRKEKQGLSTNIGYRIYDHIVSLGWSCQIAYQLERLHLRFESFPFDWLFSTNFEKVLEAIETDFQDWMLRENLEESNFTETEHKRIVDRKYDTVIQHFFPLDKPLKESFPEVNAMMRRRVERFLTLGGGGTLFVRTDLNEEQSVRAAHLIRSKYGDGAELLIVNHTHNFEMKEIFTGYDNFYMVEIYDENECTGQDWKGYNPHWSRLFTDVRIRREKVDLQNNIYFEGFYECENRSKRSQFRWSNGESVLHLEEYGGCKCTLFLSAPVPIHLEISNVYGEVIRSITFSKSAAYCFDIKHETRFIRIKSNRWCPHEIFASNDSRNLGACLDGIEVERPYPPQRKIYTNWFSNSAQSL